MNDTRPLLVMLPGLDGTGICLEPIKEALGDTVDSRIIAYPRDKAMDYRQLHDWLLPRYMPKEPFYLLAESFGGPLAVMLAATLGNRLRGLILAATFLHRPLPGNLQRLGRAALPFYHPLLPQLAPIGLMLGKNAALHAKVREIIATIPAEVMKTRMQAALEADVRSLYAALAIPVLALCPGKDRLMRRSAEQFRQDNAIVHVIDDGVHLLLQEETETCAEYIKEFIGI